MPQRFAASLPIILYLSFLATAPESSAQSLDWIREEKDTRSRRSGDGVAIDQKGNVFITGDTSYLLPNGKREVDGFISKYDGSGNQLWSTTWGTQCGVGGGVCRQVFDAVSTDSQGNAYVVGETWYSGTPDARVPDAVVLKYGPDGTLEWETTLGTSEADRYNDLTVDQFGNLYAVGSTAGTLGQQSFGGSDAILSKIDSEGDVAWTIQYDTLDDSSAADSVTVDPLGNIYANGGGGIRKFQSNGSQVWFTPIEATRYVSNFARPELAFGDDGLYAVDRTKREDSDQEFVVLTRFDSDGNLLWDREYNARNNTSSNDIEVDGQGHVYVIGSSSSESATGIREPREAYVSRFDSNGNLQWIFEVGGPLEESGVSLAIADDGSVFLTGDIRCSREELDCGDPQNPVGHAFVARLGIDENFTPGDFNFDGQLSILDVDLLSQEIQQGSVNSFYDLNHDLAVTSEDLAIWITDNKGTFAGDANLDSKVDFEDFLALSAGFGSEGTWSQGDFDASGSVEFADFLLLSQNFGQIGSATQSVPEPGTSVLLSMAFATLLLQRNRRPSGAIN